MPASIPFQPAPLILASKSPRRRELLQAAGYQFTVLPASDSAECGVCSGESPAELVARLARQKAEDVIATLRSGPHAFPQDAIVVGCDTVAECQGQVLGKPADETHARRMLETLRGREHWVLSGLCLWRLDRARPEVRVDVTRLRMDPLDDAAIEDYLMTGQWEGKAGAFGYQDRMGWVHVIEGSESNVVGLPMELLAKMLEGMRAA